MYTNHNCSVHELLIFHTLMVAIDVVISLSCGKANKY